MYTVVIQAGGKSSRMGEDKSLLTLHGRQMIQLVSDKVAPLGNELIITSNDPTKFAGINAVIVRDEFLNVGALAGLHSGIKAASNDLVVVVATDMPFISIGLIEYMKTLISPDVDVVIPVSEKGFEPFHAIYRKSSCLPAIESAIYANKRRIISWFEAVRVVTVEQQVIERFDPKGLAFFNVNTPEDLSFAEQTFLSDPGFSA